MALLEASIVRREAAFRAVSELGQAAAKAAYDDHEQSVAALGALLCEAQEAQG